MKKFACILAVSLFCFTACASTNNVVEPDRIVRVVVFDEKGNVDKVYEEAMKIRVDLYDDTLTFINVETGQTVVIKDRSYAIEAK